MSQQVCRRCLSSRVFALEKKRKEDNYVYRCRDCGYLFSPPPSGGQPRAESTKSDYHASP